jgi:hypothetical protein
LRLLRKYPTPDHRGPPDARHSADEIERPLLDAGFEIADWGRTPSRPLREIGEIEALRPGRGEGAFLVVVARKPAGG